MPVASFLAPVVEMSFFALAASKMLLNAIPKIHMVKKGSADNKAF